MGGRTIVVGGGIAGLAAAAFAARLGSTVTLVERSGEMGGRARTTAQYGFRLNLGPHALYRAGAGQLVLDELGVDLTGRGPGPHEIAVHRDGRVRPAVALRGAARDLPAMLRLLSGARTRQAHDTSLTAWLDDNMGGTVAREAVLANVRLTTYSHDPDEMSVAAAARALRLGMRGVRYLDGGWQSLVAGLTRAAAGAGATLHRGAFCSRVEHDDRVHGVRLTDGTVLPADAVVIASGGPGEAAALLADGPAGPMAEVWAKEATPVKAACLDVGLRRAPRPRAAAVVLGIDAPVYLSEHSRYADLAPGSGALIHVMRYRSASERADAPRHRAELESLLDAVQPGWRDQATVARFLPDITVAHDLPSSGRGGLPGRPGTAMPGVEGLYLAGDFVGPEGLLADAALASARVAGRAAGMRRGDLVHHDAP